jgi:hypothetical protein
MQNRLRDGPRLDPPRAGQSAMAHAKFEDPAVGPGRERHRVHRPFEQSSPLRRDLAEPARLPPA